MMKTQMNLSQKVIQVCNDDYIFMLKINKVKLINKVKTIGVFLFFLIYLIVTTLSYAQSSEMFYKLIEFGVVFTLISFIALNPVNKFKFKSK